MRDLPSGTVTFLFTDVEGSTRVLDELGADAYASALAEHRRIIRDAIAAHGGVEVDTQGDAFFVVFPTALGALDAAVAACEALVSSPIRVRVGIHTGTPLVTDEGYIGQDVHRAARIAAAGHGGQILVSSSTASLLGSDGLRDLGEHRLKDLTAPERIYQVGDDDFPPLKSLYHTNLPVPATPFVGREHELQRVVELLAREDTRLVTLTGPGGTGKTRLALHAAAEVSDRFPDGVWWVPLAPMRDPALLPSAVVQALELEEERSRDPQELLSTELAGMRPLLLLDNAEHLLPEAASGIAGLLTTTGAVALVTSRERLQLQGEHVYPVPTMTEDDGIELFLARARALEPDIDANGSTAELCARLDNLPLALELAAARTALFSAEQLVARLSQRLDLLKGGRDADPRQQTLRATIEWSHDLLSPNEQRLFRCLSVFAGGCTYEAAELVCEAEPDSLHSLIDKSLLRRRDSDLGSRYWMLETIREYAAERLDEAADAWTLRQRHAEWCCKLAERLATTPEGTAPWSDIEEQFAGLQEERGNVQAALAWAWSTGHDELGLRLGVALRRFWMMRGGFSDAIAWLKAAEPRIAAVPRSLQAQALRSAGQIAFFVLADTEKADAYWTAALAIAEELGEADEIERIEALRVAAVWERGDLERALPLAERGAKKYHATGNRSSEATWLHGLGEILRDLGRFEEAERALLDANAIALEIGEHELFIAGNTHSLADLALDRGDLDAALERYCQSVHATVRTPTLVAACLAGIASVFAERKQDREAATIWGAVCAAEETSGFRMLKTERRRYEKRLRRLESAAAWQTGKEMTLEEALTLFASQETVVPSRSKR